jgi:hypothetical protein
MTLRSLFCFLLVCTVAAPAVRAGVRLEVENWAYDRYGESSRMTVYVDGSRVRFDDLDGEKSIILVSNGDESEMILMDHKPLEYVRMTREEMKKMFQTIEGGMEQMEEFLPQMPKEQREQIKKQMTPALRMWAMLQAAEDKDKEFKYSSGDDAKAVSEIECKHYVGTYKDKPFHDIWVASFDDVGVSAEDLKTLLDVPEALRGFVSIATPIASLRGDARAGGLGMPMRVLMLDADSNKVFACTVNEVHSEDVDAVHFEIDDNFDEIEFDEWLTKNMGGRR